MNKYLIRYNKTAGQPGRGSPEHVWRVFENGKEYLARHVRINVPSWSEQSGPDWNIACLGVMTLNAEFDIVEINHELGILGSNGDGVDGYNRHHADAGNGV